jgi:hypothetical protein
MPPRNSTLPRQIGPHEGRELELMLSGEKPMAMFWREPGMDPDDIGDDRFAEHVSEGRILKFVDIDSSTSIETYRYCLPTEEWRAKVSALLSRMCRDGSAFDTFTSADLSRLEGTLLGYSKQDIEAFVDSSTKHVPSPSIRD